MQAHHRPLASKGQYLVLRPRGRRLPCRNSGKRGKKNAPTGLCKGCVIRNVSSSQLVTKAIVFTASPSPHMQKTQAAQ